MLTSMKNYIDAAKRRKKEETGEEGFSLIELIIVVVILGILVAIAIPIFLNIQQQARDNSAKTIAANGATQAAAQMAQGTDAGSVDLTNLQTGDATSVTLSKPAAGVDVDTICVEVKYTNASNDWYAGPGALTTGLGCK